MLRRPFASAQYAAEAYRQVLAGADYNFVRIHKTLRVTPAMAAGVTDKLWEIGDIVALIEAKEADKPAVRGPYKKRREM